MVRWIWDNRIQGALASYSYERGEVVQMNVSDAISLMLTFGIFLIALLTYIDRNNRRK